MRDGVRLATDVYLPHTSGQFPAILQRLPYGKRQAMSVDDIDAFADAQYAVVIQDTRGRFDSEGDFTPFSNERRDGEDALRWLIQQSWCRRERRDGRRVLPRSDSMDGSERRSTRSARDRARLHVYGLLRRMDVSRRRLPTRLRALLDDAVPRTERPAEAHRRRAAGSRRDRRALIDAIDYSQLAYETMPLVDARLPSTARYYRDWLGHPARDSYWSLTAPEQDYREITIPTLNIGGWYDCFLGGTLANYAGVKAHGRTRASRSPRLIIGPWAHGVLGGEFPELMFGINADAGMLPLIREQIRFFDRHVRNNRERVDDTANVKLFVMGANVWREEQSWPIPGTRYVPYYLSGRPGDQSQSATLATAVPGAEPPDEFDYDPADPVPTVGGQTFLPGLRVAVNAGPRDQRPVESRPDVLCFTTSQLERDVDVIGPVVATLYASSSASDTDFTAKLVDVHPDGTAIILTDGILRARYRESLATPRPLLPGEIYELHIDLWATANRFKAGHRIRLEVSSSNFPRFDRNTNTGGVIAQQALSDCEVARNTIYHDGEHPSHILLPVVDPT